MTQHAAPCFNALLALPRLLFPGLLLLCALCGAASYAATPKDELEELRGRIRSLQEELAAAEESKNEARDALKQSEQAISQANRKLREISGTQAGVRGELAQLDGQRRSLTGTVRHEQELLAELLRHQHRATRFQTLPLLLSGRDPNRIMRQLHYMTYISRGRADLIDALRTDLRTLSALSASTEHKGAELVQLEAGELEQKQRLQAEQQSRARVVASLSAQINKQRGEIATLQHDESRLTRLVQELARMLARQEEERQKRLRQEAARREAQRRQAQREEAERRAERKPRKEAAPAQRPESIARNEDLPEYSVAATPFEHFRGRLKLPVRGELSNRFGSPRSGSRLSWKGLFIKASGGEEVKAVAPGRVVYADWLRGFGNMLILDHGGGFMSLYGNNETLFGQVGEIIQGGQTVAAVGNSGGNPESGLYFELRFKSKPFDPMTWVAR